MTSLLHANSPSKEFCNPLLCHKEVALFGFSVGWLDHQLHILPQPLFAVPECIYKYFYKVSFFLKLFWALYRPCILVITQGEGSSFCSHGTTFMATITVFVVRPLPDFIITLPAAGQHRHRAGPTLKGFAHTTKPAKWTSREEMLVAPPRPYAVQWRLRVQNQGDSESLSDTNKWG